MKLRGESPASLSSPRVLGKIVLTAIGINAIVGSGVFALPDDLARLAGAWSPAAYLVCGLLLLPVAISFSELSKSEEQSGGPYAYARTAFGPRVAFSIGWSCWVNSVISFAASASLFSHLMAGGALARALVALLLIVSLSLANALGAKLSGRVIVALTLAKLLAIFVFLYAGLRAGLPHVAQPASVAPQPGWASFGGAVFVALFPLQGFEVVPVPAGEAQSPRRDIGRATLVSLLCAILIYLGVQIVFLRAGALAIHVSETPLVDVARTFGSGIGNIVYWGSLVSIVGYCAGSAFGAPRYTMAMAQRAQLPERFAALHPRTKAPLNAIVINAVPAAALALLDYRKLIGFSNITVIAQYTAVCLALFARRKGSMWGAVALFGALVSLSLLFFADSTEWAVAAIALVVGLLVERRFGAKNRSVA